MYNFISHPDKNNSKSIKKKSSSNGSISMLSMNDHVKTNDRKQNSASQQRNDNVLELKSKTSVVREDYDDLKPMEWTKDMITNKLNKIDEDYIDNIKRTDEKERHAEENIQRPDMENLSHGGDADKHKVITDINELMSAVLNKPKYSGESSESGEMMLGSEDLDPRELYSNEDSFLKDYSEGMVTSSEVESLDDLGESGESDEPQASDESENLFGDEIEADQPELYVSHPEENIQQPENSNAEIKSIMEKINIEQQFFEVRQKNKMEDDLKNMRSGTDNGQGYEMNFIECFCQERNIEMNSCGEDLIEFMCHKQENVCKKIEIKGHFYINFGTSRALYLEVGNLINENRISDAAELLKQICIHSVDTILSNNSFSKLEDISQRVGLNIDLMQLVEDMCKKEETLLTLIYAY